MSSVKPILHINKSKESWDEQWSKVIEASQLVLITGWERLDSVSMTLQGTIHVMGFWYGGSQEWLTRRIFHPRQDWGFRIWSWSCAWSFPLARWRKDHWSLSCPWLASPEHTQLGTENTKKQSVSSLSQSSPKNNKCLLHFIHLCLLCLPVPEAIDIQMLPFSFIRQVMRAGVIKRERDMAPIVESCSVNGQSGGALHHQSPHQ